MKLILLSGGAGKRLWPLSNAYTSKQFVKLIEAPLGGKVSMLEHTVAHLKQLSLHEDTIVMTPQEQVSLLREQIGPDMICVAEPERRDTFPAIALAAAYLHSALGAADEEIVVVMPVDAGAEHSFFERLADLEKAMLESPWANIGLIGVKPHFASEQYGYVQLLSAEGALMPVAGFKEKPDKAGAERLIREQALWNCGVFAFRLRYMLDLLAQRGLPQQLEPLLACYSQLPARSFDFEVLEREERIGCLLYEGRWRDMGTWNAVLEDRAETIVGEGMVDDNCEGTKVLNELPLPVVVTGLRDAVVVAGHSGILVAGKEHASSIKRLVDRLEPSQTADKEARAAAGWSRLLDRHADQDEDRLVFTMLHVIPAGCELVSEPGVLRSSWTVTEGTGRCRADDGEATALCGSIYVSEGRMTFTATADTRLIETFVTTMSGPGRALQRGER